MKKWKELFGVAMVALLIGAGIGAPGEIFATESEPACNHTCAICNGEYTQSATSGALSWSCGHVHDATCSENTAVAYELAENAPDTLYVGGVGVIIEGSLTETTSGEGWSYDSTTNTLTLNNANITGVYVFDILEEKVGIFFSNGELNIDLNGENQSTYGIWGLGDTAAVTIEGEHASADSLTLSSEGILADSSIAIYNATIISNDGGITSELGNLTIVNSFVSVKYAQWGAIYAKETMTIKNSYVEANGSFYPGRDNAISDSHLVLSGEVDDTNVSSISWTDCVVVGKHINSDKVETGANCVTVYGKAALKKPLTVTGGQIINYVDSGNGASLAYEEGSLTMEDGAIVQINGEVHTHNTNGAVSYEALDATHHIKKVVCKDCIVGYVGSSTEEHSSEIEVNKATCTTQAVCDLCNERYGESLGHSYTYTSDDTANTITETCDKGCGYSGVITLKAPEDTEYDGNIKEATVEGSVLTQHAVSYNTEPRNIGTYTATLTVGEASVSVDFAITQATPTYTIPTGLTATYSQTLGDVILNTTTGDTLGTWSWEDEATTPVGDAGSRTFTATFTPNDTTNYNTVSGIALTINVLPLDITSRADISVADFAPLTYSGQMQTPEAAVTLPGTGEGKVITVTGTWSDISNVSDFTVFTATGNFTGTLAARTTGMAPKEVASPVISGLQEYYQLDGAVEPQFTLLDGNVDIPSSEYIVTYSNNTAIGTGLITIEDKDGGNYIVGRCSKEFFIKDTFDITLDGEGLTVSTSSAKAGETVTVTWNVDAAYVDDYQLELSVQGASGTEVPVTSVTGADIPDNVLKYTFVMPAESVAVIATAYEIVYSDTENRPSMDTAAVPVIDFINETIGTSAENLEYSTDITMNVVWNAVTGPLTAKPGACLWFRTKGSLTGGVFTPASACEEIRIPTRPVAACNVESVTATSIVMVPEDDKYAGTTRYGLSLYEAAEEEIIWKTGNEFTGLQPNTNYLLYVKIEAKAGEYFAFGPVYVVATTLHATPVISEVTATGTYGDHLSEILISGTANFNGTVVDGHFTWDDENADETVPEAGIYTEFTAKFWATNTMYAVVTGIPVTLVINKAANAPDMPPGIMDVSYETETVDSVTLSDGWVWAEEDASKSLIVGEEVIATAVYNGLDKGNYVNEIIEVTIIRNTCNHSYTSEITKQPTAYEEGEETYTCGNCGHSYTEAIAKLEPMPTITPGGGGGSTGGGYYPSDPVVTPTPVPTAVPTPIPTAVPTSTPVPSHNPEETWVTGETAKEYKEAEKQYDVLLGTSNKEASMVETLEVGMSIDLNFYGVKNWKKNDYIYKWTSSDESVAVVDKAGVVTMLDEGIAIIRLDLVYKVTGEKLSVAPMLIGVPEAVYDVFLGTSAKDAEILRKLAPGEPVDLNFYGVKNWKKNNYEYQWISSDEEVATVGKTGVVTAKKPGMAIIRLKLKEKTTGKYLTVAPVVLIVQDTEE